MECVGALLAIELMFRVIVCCSDTRSRNKVRCTLCTERKAIHEKVRCLLSTVKEEKKKSGVTSWESDGVTCCLPSVKPVSLMSQRACWNVAIMHLAWSSYATIVTSIQQSSESLFSGSARSAGHSVHLFYSQLVFRRRKFKLTGLRFATVCTKLDSVHRTAECHRVHNSLTSPPLQIKRKKKIHT